MCSESQPDLLIEKELLEGGSLRARWDVGALGRLGGGTKGPKAIIFLLRQPKLSRFGAKTPKDKKPFPRRP